MIAQVKKIIIAGIKGFRNKANRSKREGRPLRRTAKGSLGARIRTKLLGKSRWFKQQKRTEKDSNSKMTWKGRQPREDPREEDKLQAPRTILFVEQTPGGALASRLREVVTRLQPILGFKIKIVEKCGKPLKENFPLANLWDGTKCGRNDCTTCEQLVDFPPPPCTKPSVIYENWCRKCNPGAGGKEITEQPMDGEPSLYVGESGRSIMERSKEHWEGWRTRKDDNHINKHQMLSHPNQEPDFVMRVVSFPKSALERQLGEAVRIRRRGGEGAILNSRAEDNRSYIPRLRLEKREGWEQRQREMNQLDNEKSEELSSNHDNWEREKFLEKWEDDISRWRMTGKTAQWGKRRPPKERGNGNSKRRKYSLVEENWGEDGGCTNPSTNSLEGSSTTLVKEEPVPSITTPPPVWDNTKKRQPTIRQFLTTPTPHPNIKSKGGVPDTLKMDRNCNFNSTGWCKLHEKQGETVKVKMTKWGKKKDGLFGRVRTTRDKFICQGQQSASLADRESENSDASVQMYLPGVGESLTGINSERDYFTRDDREWELAEDYG